MQVRHKFASHNAFDKSLCLHVRDLACRRSLRPVFLGVNFTLAAGRALSVCGANGAGKTSLLRCVAGLLSPMAGKIELVQAAKTTAICAPYCHYLGHADGLKTRLSVIENIEIISSLFGDGGSKGHAGLEGVVERLGLTGYELALVSDLSAGQKRRVALARLVLGWRQIWLLDEPFAALDGGGRNLLTRLAKEHLVRGGIILVASHEPLAFAPDSLILGSLALGRAKNISATVR